DDRGLVTEHRPGLVEVERLALREVLDDVDEDDIGVVAARHFLRYRRADVAGPHDRDPLPAGSRLEVVEAQRELAHGTRAPRMSPIASAPSLVPAAVGSSRVGFRS